MPFPILAVLSLAALQLAPFTPPAPLAPPNRAVTPALVNEAALPKVATVKVTLTLTGGGGTVSLAQFVCRASDNEPEKTCTGRVRKGTPIVAQRTMPGGTGFRTWGGACTGAGVCTVAADDDIVLSAAFDLIDAQELTVTLPANPGSRVHIFPAWPSDYSDGGGKRTVTYRVRTGQTVNLQIFRPKSVVEQKSGQLYGNYSSELAMTSWAEDCAGTVDKICTLTMTQPRRAAMK